jgi:hypothetical protein
LGFFVFFFPSRHTSIMIVNGKAFEGTFDYEYTDGRLKMCVGNSSCINEFQPVRFPSAMMIYKLLHALHKFHFCCFLTETFVLFTSGSLGSFDWMTLFIVMTDSTVILHFSENSLSKFPRWWFYVQPSECGWQGTGFISLHSAFWRVYHACNYFWNRYYQTLRSPLKHTSGSLCVENFSSFQLQKICDGAL